MPANGFGELFIKIGAGNTNQIAASIANRLAYHSSPAQADVKSLGPHWAEAFHIWLSGKGELFQSLLSAFQLKGE